MNSKEYAPELRKFAGPLKFLAFLLSKKWGAPIVHSMFSFSKGKNIKGLRSDEVYVPSLNGGQKIRTRIFRPNNDDKLPAVLYLHGGGYLIGNPETSLDIIEALIRERDCVVVAPDYRKGLKVGYPDGFNDCYDTLAWMKNNAQELNIRDDKFIVAGISAGGGLTAAVTLKACDTGDFDIAFQLPACPMIDHRQSTDSAKTMTNVPTWNAHSNKLGWSTYLQNIQGKVPPYASPSLAEKYSHLPPTVTYIGSAEPFRDETIAYVEELKKAGVPVKFELFKGGYHGFEVFGKDQGIGKMANEHYFKSFGEYYDTYL